MRLAALRSLHSLRAVAATREEADRRTMATQEREGFDRSIDRQREDQDRPTAGATMVAAVSRSPKWRTPVSPALIYMPAGGISVTFRSAKMRAAFL